MISHRLRGEVERLLTVYDDKERRIRKLCRVSRLRVTMVTVFHYDAFFRWKWPPEVDDHNRSGGDISPPFLFLSLAVTFPLTLPQVSPAKAI